MGHRRQQNPEAGALARLALNFHGTSMRAQDSQDRRQSQSPARELRGEKGVEEFLSRALVDAAARVGHLEADVAALRELLVDRNRVQVVAIATLKARGNSDDTVRVADRL